MELQICLLVTTLVFCRADIRPAGWLDKVVAHWKKSFIDDFEQLGAFNLEASIEPAPPGYQDSPDWDFDSVSRLLALLSVSETGQPALNSLRRMIAPTRRVMMDEPGFTGSYIPRSLYSLNDRRGIRNYLKRMGNRMGANKRMGMANNRKGMANNRMGMANHRMGMANHRKGQAYYQMGIQSKTGNGKLSRKQMRRELVKVKKERVLSDFQKTFREFPSIRDQFLNDIYYDGMKDDYEDLPEEYEMVDTLKPNKTEDAIVVVRNPVEARLPSARISVKLLKEILVARAKAAREMPAKKTTRFSWKPMNVTTSLNKENSTADTTVATGGTDDGAATGSADVAPTTAGPVAGGEAPTEAGAPPEGKPEGEEGPPPDARKMAKTSNLVANISKVAAEPLRGKA